MNRPYFESHSSYTKDFPIIFHYDYVKEDVMQPHWHPNIEILYASSGEGSCIINNEEYEMKKGDIIIVNSNSKHMVKTESQVNYYCLITDSYFCEQNDIFTEQLEYMPHVTDNNAAELFDDIINAFSSELDFKEAEIKIAVLKLILYLSRNYTSKEEKRLSKISAADENIKIAMGYIKSHYNQKLTLEKVAYEAGLSKYYFLREFKTITKMTFVEYINSVRCENAKKLLLKNMYTIHEIAVKCGFENDSYFSKTFRKYEGCLPSEFKMQQYRVNENK